MIINRLIHDIFTISPEYIETDFLLLHEGDIISIGKAKINKYYDYIELNGNCKDINISKFTDELNNNIIHINANDFPQYYSCQLSNFPIFNRINDFIDKDIVINLPKVKVDSDLSFNMFSDGNTFKCKIIPLYSDNKLGEMICK